MFALFYVLIQILLFCKFCRAFVTFEVFLTTMNQPYVPVKVIVCGKNLFTDITLKTRLILSMLGIQMSRHVCCLGESCLAFGTFYLWCNWMDFTHVLIEYRTLHEYCFANFTAVVPPCWCHGFLENPSPFILWEPIKVSKWCRCVVIATRPRVTSPWWHSLRSLLQSWVKQREFTTHGWVVDDDDARQYQLKLGKV